MRFSHREYFGLRAMVELARRYGEGPVSLADVAAAEDISLSYLEQVISPLRKAGLLESQRGARGGYSLSLTPSKVTAGDVIRAFDGPLVPLKCIPIENGANTCARESCCTSRAVWQKVHERLEEALDSITLADLTR